MKSRALDRKLRDEEKKLSRLLEAICLKSDVRIDHQGFPIASSSDISPFPSSGQIRTIGVQVNKDELADSDEDEAFYRRFDPSQHSLERWDSIVNEQLKNDQRSQMLKMKAMLKKAHNKITELHAIILKLMQWKNSTANHVTLFLDTFQHKTKKHLSHDANTIPPHFMEDLSKTITQVKNRVEEKLELPGFVRSLHRDPKLHQFQFSAESLQDDSIADESIPSPVATEKGKQESKSNEKQTPTKSVAAEESKPKSAVSKLFSGTKHQSDKDSDSNGGWSNSDSDEGPIVSSKVPFQFNSKKDSAESVAPNFGVVLRSAPPPPPAANKPPPPPPPHVVKANKFAESQQQKLQEANATKAPSHAYTTSPAKKPFGGSPAYKKTTPTKYEVIKVEVAKGITPGVCVECRKNMDLKTIFPLVESPSALLTPVLSKKGEEIAGYLFDMLARIQASSSDKFAQELTFQRSVDASWISKRVFLLFLLLFNLYDESKLPMDRANRIFEKGIYQASKAHMKIRNRLHYNDFIHVLADMSDQLFPSHQKSYRLEAFLQDVEERVQDLFKNPPFCSNFFSNFWAFAEDGAFNLLHEYRDSIQRLFKRSKNYGVNVDKKNKLSEAQLVGTAFSNFEIFFINHDVVPQLLPSFAARRIIEFIRPMFVREEASCILAYVFYAACYIAESRKKRKPSTAGSLTIGSLHVMDLDEGELLKTLEEVIVRIHRDV